MVKIKVLGKGDNAPESDDLEDEISSNTSPFVTTLNQLVKKPQIEAPLSELLDNYMLKVNRSNDFTSCGIFATNFVEAGFVVQLATQLYSKKLDLLWESVLSYQQRAISYENEDNRNPEEIAKLNERKQRNKRKKPQQQQPQVEEQQPVAEEEEEDKEPEEENVLIWTYDELEEKYDEIEAMELGKKSTTSKTLVDQWSAVANKRPSPKNPEKYAWRIYDNAYLNLFGRKLVTRVKKKRGKKKQEEVEVVGALPFVDMLARRPAGTLCDDILYKEDYDESDSDEYDDCDSDFGDYEPCFNGKITGLRSPLVFYRMYVEAAGYKFSEDSFYLYTASFLVPKFLRKHKDVNIEDPCLEEKMAEFIADRKKRYFNDRVGRWGGLEFTDDPERKQPPCPKEPTRHALCIADIQRRISIAESISSCLNSTDINRVYLQNVRVELEKLPPEICPDIVLETASNASTETVSNASVLSANVLHDHDYLKETPENAENLNVEDHVDDTPIEEHLHEVCENSDCMHQDATLENSGNVDENAENPENVDENAENPENGDENAENPENGDENAGKTLIFKEYNLDCTVTTVIEEVIDKYRVKDGDFVEKKLRKIKKEQGGVVKRRKLSAKALAKLLKGFTASYPVFERFYVRNYNSPDEGIVPSFIENFDSGDEADDDLEFVEPDSGILSMVDTQDTDDCIIQEPDSIVEEPNSTEEHVSQEPTKDSGPKKEDDAYDRKSVGEWRRFIRRKIRHMEEKSDFDIHAYGTEIMDVLPEDGTKNFKEIVEGKSAAEVVRFFISTLQLANTENVEIDGVQHGKLSNDTFTLKLLKRERYHEHLVDYQAPSEEIHEQQIEQVKSLRKRKMSEGNDVFYQSKPKKSRTSLWQEEVFTGSSIIDPVPGTSRDIVPAPFITRKQKPRSPLETNNAESGYDTFSDEVLFESTPLKTQQSKSKKLKKTRYDSGINSAEFSSISIESSSSIPRKDSGNNFFDLELSSSSKSVAKRCILPEPKTSRILDANFFKNLEAPKMRVHPSVDSERIVFTCQINDILRSKEQKKDGFRKTSITSQKTFSRIDASKQIQIKKNSVELKLGDELVSAKDAAVNRDVFQSKFGDKLVSPKDGAVNKDVFQSKFVDKLVSSKDGAVNKDVFKSKFVDKLVSQKDGAVNQDVSKPNFVDKLVSPKDGAVNQDVFQSKFVDKLVSPKDGAVNQDVSKPNFVDKLVSQKATAEKSLDDSLSKPSGKSVSSESFEKTVNPEELDDIQLKLSGKRDLLRSTGNEPFPKVLKISDTLLGVEDEIKLAENEVFAKDTVGGESQPKLLYTTSILKEKKELSIFDDFEWDMDDNLETTNPANLQDKTPISDATDSLNEDILPGTSSSDYETLSNNDLVFSRNFSQAPKKVYGKKSSFLKKQV